MLAWGKNNITAIELKQTLYLWNAHNKTIRELLTVDESDYITSVEWSSVNESTIAVGTSRNVVEVRACDNVDIGNINAHIP